MVEGWTVATVALVYIGLLFAVASYGDKKSIRHRSGKGRSAIYALTLAIYCTSWTFFGSVGLAATSGLDFLPIYIGPVLVLVFGWRLLRRIVRLSKAQNITSIADFIAARYGKSQRLAALVTVIAVIGIIPYIALQLKAVADSVTVMIGLVDTSTSLPFGDLAMVVAVAMAVFAMAFGTRHIDATEHQEGLMLAIAAESVVKLVAFLVVGGFITFYLLGGVSGIYAAISANPEIGTLFSGPSSATRWATMIALSGLIILLLPRQFHVAVVENMQDKDIRRAAWMFPLYLVAINL
ncbi:MAG: hybrid sensor histidine kinase/response regulator, partial [Alphaproteobacteria bacterium]